MVSFIEWAIVTLIYIIFNVAYIFVLRDDSVEPKHLYKQSREINFACLGAKFV